MNGEYAGIIIAILTGAAGVITAYSSLIRAKNKGNDECEERLTIARKEAEDMALELHQLRVRVNRNTQHGGIDVWILLAALLFAVCSVATGFALSESGILNRDKSSGLRVDHGARIDKDKDKQGTPVVEGPQGTQGVQRPGGVSNNGITTPSTRPGINGVPSPSGVPSSSSPSGVPGSSGPQSSPGPTVPVGNPVNPSGLKCLPGFVRAEIAVRYPFTKTTFIEVCVVVAP